MWCVTGDAGRAAPWSPSERKTGRYGEPVLENEGLISLLSVFSSLGPRETQQMLNIWNDVLKTTNASWAGNNWELLVT